MVTESVFISAAVVAVVQFLKLVKEKNWISALTIVVAAAIGLLAGWVGIEGLNLTTGFIAGLAASGVYTIVK